jgi:hypothetical protein
MGRVGAGCAFGCAIRLLAFYDPEGFFPTESERSGERLLEAASRVSGSESINQIIGMSFYPKFRS